MQKHDLLDEMLAALQKPEVKTRLQERQITLQENLRTSIGPIAKALGVKEQQVRYWATQNALVSESGVSVKQEGQRRYDLSDLKKLVLIEELLRQGYALNDIAASMQEIYRLFESTPVSLNHASPGFTQSIDERINRAEKGIFWRLFIPQTLYFALSLIFEAPPLESAGLFLPLYRTIPPASFNPQGEPLDVGALEKTLVGWHERDHPFYAFFSTSGVRLDYTDRYSIIALDKLVSLDTPTGAFLVAEHKIVAEKLTKPEYLTLPLTSLALKTAQRLLSLLQETHVEWSPWLQSGADYMGHLVVDFTMASSLGDALLTKIAEIMVRAGGLDQQGKAPKWRFAAILLPKNPAAPLHQQELVVQAQSVKSPHKTGVTALKPDPQNPISLSQRAHHTGQIFYRSEITPEDEAIFAHKLEGNIRSAISVPVEGEEGRSLGAIYIASDEPEAFSEDDQRLLRVFGKMIGEVVLTYHARRLAGETLRGMVRNPQIVDKALEDFSSANAFISRLEEVLERIHAGGQLPERLSFLAIDIDRHTREADKFGDWAASNLIWEIGHEIQELFRVHSRTPGDLILYRIYADRFYVLLHDISLEQARTLAENLKRSLTHPYRIKAASGGTREDNENKILLDEVTVRLGVTSYDLERLQSFLNLSPEPVVPSVRALLTRALDQTLMMGKNLGGNCIITWDPDIHGFREWRSERHLFPDKE